MSEKKSLKQYFFGSSELSKGMDTNDYSSEEKGIERLRKVKEVKWLLPGWAGYEYYKVHKKKGFSKVKSTFYGAKAEAIRLAAVASVPVPGAYEVATIGLASLKRKIEKREVDKLSLKALKEVTPIKKFKVDKKELIDEENLKKKF